MSQVFIDDQDLTHVKYNGTWLRGGGPAEYDGTVASSTHVGDFFTVSFSGNSIAVHGTIDTTSGGVVTNYSVDGAPPAQATSQAGSGDTYKQQFWRSHLLEEGDHTLVVTMVKVNENPYPSEGTVWFDYFLVIEPRIQSNPPTTSRNIGAIVGGVLGGVLVLISIFLAIILLWRRMKRRLHHVQPWTDKTIEPNISSPENIGRGASSNPIIEPFPLGVEENRMSNPTSDTLRKLTSQHQTPGHPSSVLATTTTAHQLSGPTASSSSSPPSVTSPPSNSVNSYPASRKRLDSNVPIPDTPVAPQSSSSLVEPAIQHVDSGVRVPRVDPIQMPSDPVELPPVYSPI